MNFNNGQWRTETEISMTTKYAEIKYKCKKSYTYTLYLLFSDLTGKGHLSFETIQAAVHQDYI